MLKVTAALSLQASEAGQPGQRRLGPAKESPALRPEGSQTELALTDPRRIQKGACKDSNAYSEFGKSGANLQKGSASA